LNQRMWTASCADGAGENPRTSWPVTTFGAGDDEYIDVVLFVEKTGSVEDVVPNVIIPGQTATSFTAGAIASTAHAGWTAPGLPTGADFAEIIAPEQDQLDAMDLPGWANNQPVLNGTMKIFSADGAAFLMNELASGPSNNPLALISAADYDIVDGYTVRDKNEQFGKTSGVGIGKAYTGSVDNSRWTYTRNNIELEPSNLPGSSANIWRWHELQDIDRFTFARGPMSSNKENWNIDKVPTLVDTSDATQNMIGAGRRVYYSTRVNPGQSFEFRDGVQREYLSAMDYGIEWLSEWSEEVYYFDPVDYQVQGLSTPDRLTLQPSTNYSHNFDFDTAGDYFTVVRFKLVDRDQNGHPDTFELAKIQPSEHQDTQTLYGLGGLCQYRRTELSPTMVLLSSNWIVPVREGTDDWFVKRNLSRPEISHAGIYGENMPIETLDPQPDAYPMVYFVQFQVHSRDVANRSPGGAFTSNITQSQDPIILTYSWAGPDTDVYVTAYNRSQLDVHPTERVYPILLNDRTMIWAEGDQQDEVTDSFSGRMIDLGTELALTQGIVGPVPFQFAQNPNFTIKVAKLPTSTATIALMSSNVDVVGNISIGTTLNDGSETTGSQMLNIDSPQYINMEVGCVGRGNYSPRPIQMYRSSRT